MLEKYHLSNQTISDVCKIVGILRNANYAKENSGGGGGFFVIKTCYPGHIKLHKLQIVYLSKKAPENKVHFYFSSKSLD